jgi:hypothetical protein
MLSQFSPNHAKLPIVAWETFEKLCTGVLSCATRPLLYCTSKWEAMPPAQRSTRRPGCQERGPRLSASITSTTGTLVKAWSRLACSATEGRSGLLQVVNKVTGFWRSRKFSFSVLEVRDCQRTQS